MSTISYIVEQFEISYTTQIACTARLGGGGFLELANNRRLELQVGFTFSPA